MGRKPKPKKAKPDRLIERDGALWKKCQHAKGRGKTCPRTRPVEEFAPRRSEANLALFLQAAALYKETQSAEARATVVQHVVKECDHCRDNDKRSRVNPNSKPGQCRAYLHHLRATSFRVCVHCKTTRCIELDNVVSDADRAVLYAEGKVYVAKHHHLSDFRWWARPAHGGVEGMRLETCVVEPCCKMCHALQPTGKQANRVDPSTLPPTYPGEQRDGKAGRKMYQNRRNATKRWPRYCYNDGLKRNVGRCENLDCPRDGPGGGYCVAGVEPAFDWEHVNAKEKRAGICELCQDLPADMPEAEWKAEIDAELERGDCRLLCRNCHHLKTWYGMVPTYAPRRDAVEVVMYDGLSDEQMLRLLGVA
jgi:hypothetical protein